ncbi:predicted protein [Plenodomus lingam JN3]|uniref:Predicted protein n=2 Tax=Leptosphaeria maculans TaxID=5022 RepID=E4ZSB9_LEPMJ|nr:predicted protein [Plenodomus lingam JN3]CBX94299.1 predicted protein [Plenodomus lingam JN3]
MADITHIPLRLLSCQICLIAVLLDSIPEIRTPPHLPNPAPLYSLNPRNNQSQLPLPFVIGSLNTPTTPPSTFPTTPSTLSPSHTKHFTPPRCLAPSSLHQNAYITHIQISHPGREDAGPCEKQIAQVGAAAGHGGAEGQALGEEEGGGEESEEGAEQG